MRRMLLGLLLLVGLGACGDGALDPLPLAIGVEASQTIAGPGVSVTFVVTAQGGRLVGVTIDYGDATVDQFGTGGARTARVTFSHAYSAVGTYQVIARVTDAIAGEKDATLEVRVQ